VKVHTQAHTVASLCSAQNVPYDWHEISNGPNQACNRQKAIKKEKKIPFFFQRQVGPTGRSRRVGRQAARRAQNIPDMTLVDAADQNNRFIQVLDKAAPM
jgi:hypothetical protein